MNLSDWDKISGLRQRLKKIRSALDQLPPESQYSVVEVRFTTFGDLLCCMFERDRMADMLKAEAHHLIAQLKALGVDANK